MFSCRIGVLLQGMHTHLGARFHQSQVIKGNIGGGCPLWQLNTVVI